MGLSVIVAGYESACSLEACLRSLTTQQEVSEIIVVDCSRANPAKDLGFEFPKVQFIHFDSIRGLAELRWAGVEYAAGDSVAWLEARMIPAGDWARRMLEAQHASRSAAMIGGTIVFPSGAYERAQWAYYFCEYSNVAVSHERAGSPSGANVSFPVATLKQLRLDSACPWENELQAAWTAAGYEIGICPAEVEFRPSLDFATSARQRFHSGREFASRRFSGPKRALFAVLSPVIPFAVVSRLAGRAVRAGSLARFVVALPWIVWLTTAWALGEAVGYCFGPSKQRHIF